MDYEIHCICGHRFVLSDAELKLKPLVSCPACGQRLTPVMQNPNAPSTAPSHSADPPAATLASPLAPEPTKRCPFCGEVILAIARKCKHCNEFLDRSAPTSPTNPNPLSPQSSALITPDPATDLPVYTLTTSQWDNFWKFIILFTLWALITATLWFIPALHTYLPLGSLGTLVFAGFIAWFFYLRAKSTRVIIRPFRIDIETGLLSKNLDALELFRVSDTEFKQSFLQRLLGIGTIHLKTTDTTSSPDLTLHQIPRAREVYKYLQTQIPLAAKQRGAVYLEK